MPEIRYRYYAIGLDRSDLDTAEVLVNDMREIISSINKQLQEFTK